MKTANSAWILGVALTAAGLPACGSSKPAGDEDFLVGAPEESALQLGVTDDAASEDTATNADSIDPSEAVAESMDQASSALTAQVAPELAHCQQAAGDLNQALRRFMQPILALVRDTQPTSTLGSSQTWGPVSRGATEFRFLMRRGSAHHFGWLLEARPVVTTESFTTVAAGSITVGYAPRRGLGSVGLDLNALGALDPTVVARGTLLVGFAHGPNGSALAYRLRGFSPAPDKSPPISALEQSVHLKTGFNRVRLAYSENVTGSATSTSELVLARTRQLRGVGGRADSIATSGDVKEGEAWLISECWDADLKSVYRRVRDCPLSDLGGATCSETSEVGNEGSCAREVASAELPPADPNAAMSDPESPEGDVAAPESMPDGTPPSGS